MSRQPTLPFATVAEELVQATLDQPATLGGHRLVCVDGRAGSGKTTLGRSLVRAAGSRCRVRLLHMDDLYEGWGGLDQVGPRTARDLVEPLAQGRPAGYRRYDWHRGELAEWRPVAPVDLLVLEGVGSGFSAYHPHITTLVWVEAPRDLRIERGARRDGQAVLAHWMAWMDGEDAYFARERTRERAHRVVDGTQAE